jgi:hypothetical protein
MAHKGQAFKNFDRQDFGGCLRQIFNADFWKRQHANQTAFEFKQRRWSCSPYYT